MADEPSAPRILILRRDNIGDLVCTTPLIAGLRGQLPGAWIGALVNTYNAEVLARNTLLQSLLRAAILTNEKFRGVRLVLSPGSLKIISTNAEQEEAQDELEIDYQAETLDVGFNVTYLLDVLNNIADESVECRLADANSSALITLPGNDRFKYVVMPMRI